MAHQITKLFARKIFYYITKTTMLAAVATSVQAYEPLPAQPPIPANNPMTAEKVELGKQLYFDPRISIDGTISCNSCHNVMGSGTDNRPVSVGVGGQKGGRSAPTVWNAAFLSVQFWDGRAASLEAQAIGPMTNPIEMGAPNHDVVIKRIKTMPDYVQQFKAVFGGKNPVNLDNTAKAIAAYERTLITPNSPFDQYLAGNKDAISKTAQQGSELFQSLGCVACHMGPAFAGPQLPEGQGWFQKFPTFMESAYVAKYKLADDKGRHDVTKNEADRHMFRVPTLRNVALTAPYFHNGSVQTLDEAVRVMAATQLNKTLTQTEVEQLVAFLNTLTGEFPQQAMPRLPQTPGTTLTPQ